MELVAGKPSRKSARSFPVEGASKKKAAARILLRQLIEVEPAEIAAESEVVIAVHPDQVSPTWLVSLWFSEKFPSKGR